MSIIAPVEVVMECNIRARARVDHSVWAPCATSTPVRKPLFMLNNAEITDSRKCDVMQSKIANRVLAVEKSDGKRPNENINKSTVKKKWNKTSRKYYLDEEDDDDSDDEEDNKPKRQLIIRSGSSKIGKRILRKKGVVTETIASSNKQRKEDIQYDFLNINKSDDNKAVNDNRKNNKMTFEEKPGQDSGVSKTNINTTDFNTNEMLKSKNLAIKLANIQNSLTSSNDINVINGFVQQKRKNKTVKPNIKKLKSKLNSPIMSQNIENRKQTRIMKSNCKSFDKNESILNNGKQENVARLSVSHVIFSENREKEFRDSLQMVASDEEPSDSDSIENKFLIQQKELSQQKVETSKKIPPSDGSQLSRPKRERKSPREFWLPKNEKNDGPSSNNYIDEIVTSTETCNEVEEKAISVITSRKEEDIDLPVKTDFVKVISEMEFEENDAEDERKKYSIALGWQFSTFKWCILKIGAKCEASGRTKSNKSHFGGVLLKGRLLMKIGETEVRLKNDEMFQVPPLTDWKAFNIGRIDCILYYWVYEL